MKASKANRKKRRHVPVPIASMGDIAFLLIIFFLVCSEVSKDKTNLQVTLPESRHVEKDDVTVAARVAIDENGEIYLDGVKVDGAKDVEWGIRALLTNTVTEEQRHVQLKCDAAIPKETFEPVIKAIAEGGGRLKAVGELEN
ncbi:MAG: biopolymer transporter ExbD [Opitutae bacterium]|jgi:biopolymer transport protein ExbD|nr:biopolymer transporter ExbD [Opitutae bacterium]MBT5691204.1 biopolymer transporter ExbD [Opitutae bacterium]MBT7851967.1 biopolymer transporter ExbD [Opitutae bacterium]